MTTSDQDISQAPEPDGLAPRLVSALGAVARAVSSSLDLRTILEQVFDMLGEFVPFDSAAISLLEGDQLVVAAGRGFPTGTDVNNIQLAIPPHAPHFPVITEGRTRVVADVQAEPGWQRVPGHTLVRSWIGTPLMVDGRPIGMLTIDKWEPKIYTAGHAELAEAFAGHVVMAIRNAQLYAQSQAAFAELRRAQAELLHHERLRALGELASGVAHDFNNILSGILGNAQLLMLETDDPSVIGGLRLIERAAQDAAVTIRRLQDFTRTGVSGPLAPADLAGVADSALALTRPRWQAQPGHAAGVIRVETHLANVYTTPVEAAELRQVVINLILNAIDAMPAGGTLQVETGARGADAYVLVRDTGIGIAPDLQPRIFDPFVTTKGARGSGMGLAMSQALVARQGGRITVESAPGAGSCFCVLLPRGDTAPPAEHVSPVALVHNSGTVLVVDDDGEIRDLVSRVLLSHGYRVTVVDHAAEALGRLGAEEYDLLITDLGMAEMSGWDLVRAVRGQDRALGIIVLNGWGQGAVERVLPGALVDRTLEKPFALGALQQAVAETIARAQRRRGGEA